MEGRRDRKKVESKFRSQDFRVIGQQAHESLTSRAIGVMFYASHGHRSRMNLVLWEWGPLEISFIAPSVTRALGLMGVIWYIGPIELWVFDLLGLRFHGRP